MSTQTPEGEAAGEKKCVFVLFNPVSGKSDPEERKKSISDALAERGYTCQFIVTTKEQGARALAQQAVQEGVDLVAVSGGDGTVMEAMSALVGTSIPIAVFPAGTGNLLSVNLGIPSTVPEAVEVALSGRPYELDLARTGDGRYFAIMGGLGMDAQIIKDADRQAKARFGVLAYFWAAAKNLARRRAPVRIFLDERPPLRRRVKSVLIANMGKITGGLEAIPTASPDDGWLDVGILKAESAGQWLRLLGYTVLGRAHDDPDLEVYQARKITVETARAEPIQFDGEEGGNTRSLSVEIVPKAVRVLLPEGAPAARDTQEAPVVAAQKAALHRLLIPAAVLVLAAAGIWALRRAKDGSK